nr:conjugative transfer ATPase [Pseudomonas fragi]
MRPRATVADEAELYAHNPSFTDHLPWVEYLDTEQCFLLDDNRSVGAVFELLPIGTEGREPDWLMAARDALEDALQDSFDELDQAPWVAQFFCQDDNDFTPCLTRLTDYIQDSARGTVFTEAYLELTRRHLQAIAKPGGLFEDKLVTRLPWRGNNRRVRLVVYRWLESDAEEKGLTPVQSLHQACERIVASLQACGVQSTRVDGRGLYAWLLPWFNPAPSLTDEAPEEFYRRVAYPECGDGETLALPFDHDFAERLFFNEPRSDVQHGLWFFDDQPHRVMVVDKLRRAPLIGQLTGETRKGDAVNALFDQLPEGTVMSLSLVVKPQDVLEDQLNRLARKAIGENLASTQTRQDVEEARAIIGRQHKLYRGTLAFYVRGHDEQQLHQRSVCLANTLLGAGLQPVREGDEVATCNSYLRWLPMAYNPARDTRNWYTRLMFAQHLANLAPVWGRSTGTGHPGITLFNRGGSPLSFDPLSRLDRAMNGHLLLFGPTGAGKSATLVTLLMQVAADPHLPEKRRERAQEMGESIDLFCQGFEGELFDREGTPWPESDVTIVDLATYAREGYEAQMSISYISLMNTVNNLAERDQYLGRPIIMVTDEGHIITKNPLLAPFVVKGTKMWRKLGAWFWLATQNLADFPTAAQTMLNMIEWWICLNMPPAEIEEVARFKKLTPAQKALLHSASKEPGKYTEGVVLSKKLETLFRAVPPSLYLALAMTEPEEKAERWTLMQNNGCSELEAAYRVADRIDRARGIEPA